MIPIAACVNARIGLHSRACSQGHLAAITAHVAGSAFLEQHVIHRCLGGPEPHVPVQRARGFKATLLRSAPGLPAAALPPDSAPVPLWDADALPLVSTDAPSASLWPLGLPLTASPTRRCSQCVAQRRPGILVSPSPSYVKGHPFRKADSAAHLFPAAHATVVPALAPAPSPVEGHVRAEAGVAQHASFCPSVDIALDVAFLNPSPFPLTLLLQPECPVLVLDGDCQSTVGVVTFGANPASPSSVRFRAGTAAAALLGRIREGDRRRPSEARGDAPPADPAEGGACVVLRLPPSDADGEALPPVAVSTIVPALTDALTTLPVAVASGPHSSPDAGWNSGLPPSAPPPLAWAEMAWDAHALPRAAPALSAGGGAPPGSPFRAWLHLRVPAGSRMRGKHEGSPRHFVVLAGLLLAPSDLVLERSGLAELPPSAAATGAALAFELRVPLALEEAGVLRPT